MDGRRFDIVFKMISNRIEQYQAGRIRVTCKCCLDLGVILHADPPEVKLCGCDHGRKIFADSHPITDSQGKRICSDQL